jgi:dTDP-4-dehydrorhamnose reductase
VTASSARRVLVTGAAGMLGSELLLGVPAGHEGVGTDLLSGPSVAAAGVDLSDAAAVERAWIEHGPFVGVIHCAAYTAVDKAEEQPDLARKVNVDASRVVAQACARHGAQLVAVSTDFVFDGTKSTPYVESDAAAPLSVYGVTKLDGERATLAAHPAGSAIVRTQWLYGPRGKHFPRTIVGFAREKGRLKVVADQFGAPTTTLELAPALWDVLLARATGIYHAACPGSCSWHGFTRAILDECGLQQVVLEACDTSAFPRPARRPAYSVLDSSKLAALRGRPMAPWREALKNYLAVEPL